MFSSLRDELLHKALELKREADGRGYKAGWIYYTLVRDFPFLAASEWYWLAGLLGYSQFWAKHKIEEQKHAEAFGQDRWGRGADTFMQDAFAEYWKKEQEKYRERYRQATGRYPEDAKPDDYASAYQEGSTWHHAHSHAREEWSKSHTHSSGAKQSGTKAKQKQAGQKAQTQTIDVRENDALKLLKMVKPYTRQELKTAFRVAAKKWHPDMDNGNAEKFRAVNDAYNYLMEKCK